MLTTQQVSDKDFSLKATWLQLVYSSRVHIGDQQLSPDSRLLLWTVMRRGMIPFHLSLTRNLLGFTYKESTISDWGVIESGQVGKIYHGYSLTPAATLESSKKRGIWLLKVGVSLLL